MKKSKSTILFTQATAFGYDGDLRRRGRMEVRPTGGKVTTSIMTNGIGGA